MFTVLKICKKKKKKKKNLRSPGKSSGITISFQTDWLALDGFYSSASILWARYFGSASIISCWAPAGHFHVHWACHLLLSISVSANLPFRNELNFSMPRKCCFTLICPLCLVSLFDVIHSSPAPFSGIPNMCVFSSVAYFCCTVYS